MSQPSRGDPGKGETEGKEPPAERQPDSHFLLASCFALCCDTLGTISFCFLL